MKDVLGPAIVEARDYLTTYGGDFATVVVRGGTPGPGDAPPFIVLSHAGQLRDRRTGVVRQRIQSRAYGKTPQQAAQIAALISDCFHDRGPRVHGGVGIYDSYEEVGQQPDTDPDTGWPLEIGFYRLAVASQGVA